MIVVGGRHLTLFVFSKNVNFLINEMLEHSTNDKKILDNVNEKLKTFSKFANIFFRTILVTVTGLFFLPLISKTKLLPYKIWFPFDHENNIVLLVSTKVYAIICMSLFVFSALSTLLIWYVMLNVSIKYQTFGSHLKSLNGDGENSPNCEQLIKSIKFFVRIRK